MNIDARKWFDRSQPQTLQIATFLLYLNAFFQLLDLFDIMRFSSYGITDILNPGRSGLMFWILGIPLNVLAGLLMANDRKLGYYLAVAGAVWPFLIRFYYSNFRFGAIFDARAITLIFELALVALVLHTQSRDHQRIWFK